MAEERVFRNTRFTPAGAFFGLAVYAVFYMAPAVLLGWYVRQWAGLVWMGIGAVLFLVFAWRSLFAPVIIADRDGFRVEGRWATPLAIGYDKIHEAKWEPVSVVVRKAIGPVFFSEPAWFLQKSVVRRLVIMYGGDPLVFREDEFADLGLFAETLAKHRVRGLVDDSGGPTLRPLSWSL